MKLFTLIILSCLVWTKQSSNGLTNTNWYLLKVSKNNKTQLSDPSCATTLLFDNGGKYSGYSGCNRFGGNYSFDTNSQLTMDSLTQTKRACADKYCLGEEDVLGQLSRVNKFLIQADTLVLLTMDSVKIYYLKK